MSVKQFSIITDFIIRNEPNIETKSLKTPKKKGIPGAITAITLLSFIGGALHYYDKIPAKFAKHIIKLPPPVALGLGVVVLFGGIYMMMTAREEATFQKGKISHYVGNQLKFGQLCMRNQLTFHGSR